MKKYTYINEVVDAPEAFQLTIQRATLVENTSSYVIIGLHTNSGSHLANAIFELGYPDGDIQIVSVNKIKINRCAYLGVFQTPNDVILVYNPTTLVHFIEEDEQD